MSGTLARNALKTSLLALGAALACGGANAQSVISRTIAPEPVETIVTQTPTGTVVTRRPVAAPADVGVVAPAVSVSAPTVVETIPNTVDAITTREVIRRRDAVESSRRLVTRQVSARPETTRTVKRASTTVTRSARPRLVLRPAERHVIYQTIVEREVVPSRTVVAPAPTYVAPVAPALAEAPVMAADYDDEPVYTVGSVLPRNTPLYALPQNVALRVPATQSYSYAWLGGRAYLVDPVSGAVVADVTE
jgi:hypothetical protein